MRPVSRMGAFKIPSRGGAAGLSAGAGLEGIFIRGQPSNALPNRASAATLRAIGDADVPHHRAPAAVQMSDRPPSSRRCLLVTSNNPPRAPRDTPRPAPLSPSLLAARRESPASRLETA